MTDQMKKIDRRKFCKVAAATVALGASLGAADRTTSLRVATFQCEVTPSLGQAIYSSYKPLTTIEHPLLAKGIVLEENGRRFVLCSVDWCELCNDTHTLFRRKLAEAVGTDIKYVAIHTVHQHTAPMGDYEAFALIEKLKNPPPHLSPSFFKKMATRVGESAKQAVAQLVPFDRIGTGEAKVERVASSRRVRGKDGNIIIRWSSCTDPELRAMPEGLIDPMLKTVTLAQGDKPLVRMHYYATHPQSFYGDPRTSYDFPGIAREALQEEEGVFQIYFTGCAGDITAGKYNDRTRRAREELTQHLLEGMKASVATTQFVPAGPIRWRTTSVRFPLRTDAGYTLADCSKTLEEKEGATSAHVYGGAMRVAYINRIEKPIELSSLQMGKVHLLHLPGEAMIEFQLTAQKLLPNDFVATAAYGDCGTGYICTKVAFQEGGYEPTDSMVAPEGETVLQAAIRKLLGVND